MTYLAITTLCAVLFIVIGCSSSDSRDTTTPSAGEYVASGGSFGCSGLEKEKADEVVIDSFNYGYRIGLGIAVEPAELSRIQQGYAQLTPACQRYVESIGERLKRMYEEGEIRREIDKLPF